MNKNENEQAHRKAATARPSGPKDTKSSRRKRQARGHIASPAESSASDSLSGEAKRLLGILGQSEARVFIDPTDESSVIVHRKRAGISVGAGRFARPVPEALVRQELAVWRKEA